MRQTLIRIRLVDLWSLEPIGGVTAIGAGYLLIPWLLLGAWWGYRNLRKAGFHAEHAAPAIVWLLAGCAILFAPRLSSRPYLPVFGYGFMMGVAFFVSAWWGARRAEREGFSRDLIWDLAMWVLVGGVLGARLFYIFQYRDRVFAHCEGLKDYLLAAVSLWDGGLVFYGGMLLATGGYVLFCLLRKVDPLRLGDVAVPPVFLGLGFGRIGCFLNGCCYGDRCDLPWGVAFPHGSVPFGALVQRGLLPETATQTYPLHPTQLYSALGAFLLAAITAWYFKHRSRNGAVVALALLTYPVQRFVLEILRGDEPAQFGTGLTIAQLVSLAIFTVGLGFTWWLSVSGRPRPTADSARVETHANYRGSSG